MKFQQFFQRFKWVEIKLFGPATVINGTGLIILYSITSTTDGDSRFWKQLVFFVIGMILAVIIGSIDYQKTKGYAPWLYGLSLLLLILVLFIGDTIRGTRGWFSLAGFGIQPVEFVKIMLCIVLAHSTSRIYTKLHEWKSLIMLIGIMGIPITLVLLQPDAGSAIILTILTMGLILAKGITKYQIMLGIACVAICLITAWFSLLKPYQKERIEIFLGIKHDPYGIAYNVDQSIIAIGSGGLFGSGIGSGSQSQLRYLPEAPTDFIFASTAEELGLIGALLIIGAYAVFMKRIFTIASETRDGFSAYLAYGIGIIFLSHITINLGAVLGLLPVAGVPLPFMSYGGSFLLTSWTLLGVAMSINRRNQIVY